MSCIRPPPASVLARVRVQSVVGSGCVREPAALSEAEARSAAPRGARADEADVGPGRAARRARQRRRVYQSGKGRATNRGGPGGRQAHRWPVCCARDLPRPVPRQRPGPAYGLVLLGDPPSFDEDDSDPHCCVKPLDAVALPSLAATAACRTRYGPTASCSAPMVSRSRYLLTVRPGMPPRPPPLPQAPRQSRLRCRTSAVSPRAPRTFQKSREAAACRIRCPPRPRSGAWRIGFDSPPPPVNRAAWRIRAHAGASPAAAPPYSRIAPLRFGTWASPSTSYGCRAHTGFPPAVWSHQSVGMAPDHAATGRLQHGRYDSASTKAAPEKSSYHPCRCCAKGRFSAPSLPDPRTGRHAAQGAFGRFRPPER